MLFMLAAYVVAGYGPSFGDTFPLLGAHRPVRRRDGGALRLGLAGRRELHDAAGGGRGRRDLLLLVPAIVAGVAIETVEAPDWLTLLGIPFVARELTFRIFDEYHDEGDPIETLSTTALAAALIGWVVLGALLSWLRYRRIEASR